MNSLVVLDACTIINLARIDEDYFIEDKIKALMNVYAVEMVINELKDRYVPSVKTLKRQLHYVPYWGGLKKWENKEVEDKAKEVKVFLDYQKKDNGELYSTALSILLSRLESEKVLFYTDDFPAKNDFRPYFEFQQMGYIGDTVDLLVFLYWLSPKGQFSKDELEKYLTSLRGEYILKVKELQEMIDHYALMQPATKKGYKRKYELEGLSADLTGSRDLIDTINRCIKFFEDDKSVICNDIKKMLKGFTNCPLIVKKIDRTLQSIYNYGIYKL